MAVASLALALVLGCASATNMMHSSRISSVALLRSRRVNMSATRRSCADMGGIGQDCTEAAQLNALMAGISGKQLSDVAEDDVVEQEDVMLQMVKEQETEHENVLRKFVSEAEADHDSAVFAQQKKSLINAKRDQIIQNNELKEEVARSKAIQESLDRELEALNVLQDDYDFNGPAAGLTDTGVRTSYGDAAAPKSADKEMDELLQKNPDFNFTPEGDISDEGLPIENNDDLAGLEDVGMQSMHDGVPKEEKAPMRRPPAKSAYSFRSSHGASAEDADFLNEDLDLDSVLETDGGIGGPSEVANADKVEDTDSSNAMINEIDSLMSRISATNKGDAYGDNAFS